MVGFFVFVICLFCLFVVLFGCFLCVFFGSTFATWSSACEHFGSDLSFVGYMSNVWNSVFSQFHQAICGAKL